MSNQKGLSLIELLVAIALSAFLLFGVIQIFLANKQTSTLQHSLGEVQEAGRIVSEFISKDIRLADHWGCAPSLDAISSQLSYAASTTKDLAPLDPTDFRRGISVNENVSSASVGSISVKDDTDMITLRGAKLLANANLAVDMASPSSAISINSGISVDANTPLLISDCDGGDIFAVSNADTSNGTIEHDGGLNTSSALSKAYTQQAQLYTLFTHQYFVGLNDDNSYSLYLKENASAPAEIVRNVKNLSLTFGEDADSDGATDRFHSSYASISNPDHIISIHIEVATESSNRTILNGNPLERNYRVTANLRNRGL